MIDIIPRKDVLRRHGLRRDILSDVFVRNGWKHEPYDQTSEVLVKFKGTDSRIPPLKALFVGANVEEYVLLDRHNRHWAVSKEKWEIVPVGEGRRRA